MKGVGRNGIGPPRRGARSASAAIVLAFAAVLCRGDAQAADGGLGRRTVGIAEIDPTSAVAGSVQVRSMAAMEAETGHIEIRDATTQMVLGSKNTKRDGQYTVDLSSPLADGQIIVAVNRTRNYFSSGVKVSAAAPPAIVGPLVKGQSVVTGYGTPGHSFEIVDVVTGASLGQTAAPTPSFGDGSFKILLTAPLRLFQIVMPVDQSAAISGRPVPVFSLSLRSITPSNPCPMKPGRQQAGALEVTTYLCRFQHPRGIAVGPDGKVYVATGAPPADIIHTTAAGIFRLDPDTGEVTLFAPVNGVGIVFGPASMNNDLFIARPRLHFVRKRVMLDRGDGEIFRAEQMSGDTFVYQRILETSPTGITFDANGNAFLTSYFGDEVVYSDSDGEVFEFASGIPGLWAVVFGVGAFGSDMFVSQPGAGRILRIDGLAQVSLFAEDLTTPTGLAFGPGGRAFGNFLYVADTGAGEIVRIDATGAKMTFSSGFKAPFGVAFDPSTPAMFISDFSTGEIIRIR